MKTKCIFIEHDRWMIFIHPGDQKIVLLEDKAGRQILISGGAFHLWLATDYIDQHQDSFNDVDQCIIGTGFLSEDLHMSGGGKNEIRKLTDEDLIQFQEVLNQAIKHLIA